jgi:hypothetical protein
MANRFSNLPRSVYFPKETGKCKREKYVREEELTEAIEIIRGSQ